LQNRMSRFSFFIDAFSLLVKNPKLFLPKFVIAVLYGFLLLESAQLSLVIVPSALSAQGLAPEVAAALLGRALVLFVASLVVLILDIWVSSWYPVLVSDFHSSHSVSFSNAVSVSRRRFSVVFPLLLGLELLVSVLFSLISTTTLIAFREWFWVVMAVVLGMVLVFYAMLYPLVSVSMLEPRARVDSLRRSLQLSFLNWRIFSPAAAFSFLVSSVNFALAFLAQESAFFVLFWGLRIVVAVLATYNAVVNPSAYLAAVHQ